MKIALIGSRRMSQYGKRVIDRLVPELVKRDCQLVVADVGGCALEVKRVCSAEKGDLEIIRLYSDFADLNRRLAQRADVVLVIEGAKESGTMLVAKEALDLGKEVWAVPGRVDDPNSWTPNFLIKNGARVIERVEDVEP